MEAVQVAQRMSAEEYLALPEPESGRDWTTLVEGEVVVTVPTPLHNYVKVDLCFELQRWARSKRGRGRVMDPLDVQLDARNVFNPDILWYAEGRAPARNAPRPSPMPDVAVEVRSPSTWQYDIGAKKAAYERHGLPELWLVDTSAEAVLIFRRSSAGNPGVRRRPRAGSRRSARITAAPRVRARPRRVVPARVLTQALRSRRDPVSRERQ